MELLFDKIAGGEKVGLLDSRLGDRGLRPLQFLYGTHWKGTDGRIDFDKVRETVPQIVFENDLLCINVEGPEWGGMHVGSGDVELWRRDRDEVMQLLELLRELLPDVKLSLFALPASNCWNTAGWCASRADGSRGELWRNWVALKRFWEFQQPLIESLDFLTPEQYWLAPHWYLANKPVMVRSFVDEFGQVSPVYQRWTSVLQVWIENALHSFGMIQELWPGKPLIPVISCQWWTGMGGEPSAWDAPARGELVYPSWVLASIEAIREHCDSIAIWIHPDNVGGFTPDAYFASDGWQEVLSLFP